MNTQHTPGPWKAVYIGCGDWDLNGPVTQEDWKLAAAAPDLLEALENLLKAVEWSEAKPVHNLTTLGRAMAKAKTVVARAEAA